MCSTIFFLFGYQEGSTEKTDFNSHSIVCKSHSSGFLVSLQAEGKTAKSRLFSEQIFFWWKFNFMYCFGGTFEQPVQLHIKLNNTQVLSFMLYPSHYQQWEDWNLCGVSSYYLSLTVKTVFTWVFILTYSVPQLSQWGIFGCSVTYFKVLYFRQSDGTVL